MSKYIEKLCTYVGFWLAETRKNDGMGLKLSVVILE